MLATSEAGSVADQAEVRKKVKKYANLQSSHLFVPVAIETAGAFGQEALTFLQELGHRLRVKMGEPQSHHHLLQRIAMDMQRGNTAAILGTMTVPTNDFDNAYIHLLLNDSLHVCTCICVCQPCIYDFSFVYVFPSIYYSINILFNIIYIY